ncbi:hypothetical protein DESUT3_24230 [Desulfuromonas versatilis]|uniref:Uncharacterized protein n=1 Tax=Desulfuromonas versatilis TaxID=2802975 RepID=A0ABM8HXU5_9BACT|nr:hypothetical protein DESUT3_24230 [Desulfuromonas versatilis]
MTVAKAELAQSYMHQPNQALSLGVRNMEDLSCGGEPAERRMNSGENYSRGGLVCPWESGGAGGRPFQQMQEIKKDPGFRRRNTGAKDSLFAR